MSDHLPINPTIPVKPTLKTIFRYGYLAAFNAHDGNTVMSYISPNIKVTLLGSPAPSDPDLTPAESFRHKAEEHWASADDVSLEIIEIEEFDEGVVCVLYDNALDKTLTIKYWFAEEGGKWVHVLHELIAQEAGRRKKDGP